MNHSPLKTALAYECFQDQDNSTLALPSDQKMKTGTSGRQRVQEQVMMTVKRQKSKSSQSSTLSHSNRGKGRMPAWPFAPPDARGARVPIWGRGAGSARSAPAAPRPSGPPCSRGPDRAAADSQDGPLVQGFSSPAGSGGLSPSPIPPSRSWSCAPHPSHPNVHGLSCGVPVRGGGGAQCLAGMGGESQSRTEPRRGAHSGNRHRRQAPL